MTPDQDPDNHNNDNQKGRKIGDYLSEYAKIFKGTVERYSKQENDPFRLFALVLVWTAIPAAIAFTYYNISPQIVVYFFCLAAGALVLSAMRK